MGSIRLSKEHGLNPTILQCFWCGKDKNEIALLGSAYKGQAPMHMMLNYEPCDACKEQMAQGITCIEVTTRPNFEKQPRMDPNRDIYPTGRWSVVKRESVERWFKKTSSMLSEVLKHGKMYMEKPMYENVFKESLDETPDTAV